VRRLATGLLLGWPLPASAHGPGELAGHWVFWVLLLSLSWYGVGLTRGAHAPARWRPLMFCSGWALLAIALVGPVEHWAHASLAGHMTQHMILLAAAPPLLLLARPMPQFMQALPGAARRSIGPWMGRLYGAAGATPVLAFVVHGLVIWLWHFPTPYQLALQHQLLHDLEHATFLFAGMWFWWSLIAPGRLGRPGFGIACILAVLTLMHTGMLGALMTFAPQLLYPDHPAGFAGFDALSDQQLAGLLMWVPGGFIYSAAALALAGVWLLRTGRNPVSRFTE
jgi:putative membrane protein